MVNPGWHARDTIRPVVPLRYHSIVARRDSHRADKSVRQPRGPGVLREKIQTLRGIFDV
jgi:hypothetical protein